MLDKHYPGGASISGQRRHRCEIGRRPGQIDQREMYEGAYTGNTRADDLRHSPLKLPDGLGVPHAASPILLWRRG